MYKIEIEIQGKLHILYFKSKHPKPDKIHTEKKELIEWGNIPIYIYDVFTEQTIDT